MNEDELAKETSQQDVNLSPEKQNVEQPQVNNGPKKSVFTYIDMDIAMDSVRDIRDKVMDALPFGRRDKVPKPAEEENSEYKTVNSAEDLKGSLNACFALYGEVSMKRETIKSQKKEADPALFDIEMEEDEFEEQAGLKNQESHKKFSSYFTGKTVAKKYETIAASEIKLFKVDKENTKGGFMSILKPTIKRYVGFQDSYLIVGELIEENKLKIKSKTHLERLFKLYDEKGNSKQLTLVFFNKELNPLMPPVQKNYRFDERDAFLKRLEDEITKCGGKLKMYFNRAA